MIDLPRRSVTRFFIPLIDVLTLMFCIFLLMPLVKKTEPGDGPETSVKPPLGTAPKTGDAELSAAELAKQLKQLQQELEELKREKREALLQRLTVRILEIDPKDGRLYYRDPDLVPIDSQARALELIDRHKRQAAGREVYYLFLFPRPQKGEPLSGYPEEGQMQQYREWFQGHYFRE